jgi:hypothetical protein
LTASGGKCLNRSEPLEETGRRGQRRSHVSGKTITSCTPAPVFLPPDELQTSTFYGHTLRFIF